MSLAAILAQVVTAKITEELGNFANNHPTDELVEMAFEPTIKEDSLQIWPLVQNIKEWHYDRNLIKGSSDKDQVLKLMQEVGELSDSICKGNSPIDDIGDIIIVLVNIAERNQLTLRQCIEHAWGDIKDRKGKMVDGIFVKEDDIPDLEDRGR